MQNIKIKDKSHFLISIPKAIFAPSGIPKIHDSIQRGRNSTRQVCIFKLIILLQRTDNSLFLIIIFLIACLLFAPVL